MSTLCSNCIHKISHFFGWCLQEVELRKRSVEGEVIRGRYDQMVYKSPTRAVPRLRSLGVTFQSPCNQIYRQNLVIKMLNKDSNSKISNINAAALVDPKGLKRCYDNMMKSDEIVEKDIVRYIFTEWSSFYQEFQIFKSF